MSRISRLRTLLLSVVILSPIVSRAQGPTTGFPPYGSFEDGKFDGINRQNLNVNFAIPIMSSPGRGLNLSMGMIYDSSIWAPLSGTWSPVGGWGWKATSPTGFITFKLVTITHVRCSDGSLNINLIYSNYVYTDPAGTTHGFPLNFTDQGCTGNIVGTTSGYATDNSGYFMSDASEGAPIAITPSGVSIDYTGKMTDPNGNFISSSSPGGGETDWSDTVGHTGATLNNKTLRIIPSGLTTNYEFLDTAGAYQVVAVNYTNYTVKTNFACPGVVEYTSTGLIPFPTSIVLSNGKSYTFTYEATPGTPADITGRIRTVTLPTGGSYEYDYATTNDGINCSDASTINLTRKISDGTNISTWTFTRAPSGTNWVTTETTAAGDQSLHTFNSAGQETNLLIYQGTSTGGTLQRTINTTWAANGTPATRITILDDASTQNEVETSYDTFGNLQLLKEHDFGTGTPGPVLRTTTLTYNSYTSINLMNMLTRKTIADSTGTIKSRTDITYDQSADINTPCLTGAAQHDDSGHGCAYTTRGLLTTVTNYTDPVTPSGAISKTFTYDSFGNLRTAQVNCCQSKTWNYSSTTQYAYPDSVLSGSSPPQLTTSATYNAYTGQLATFTDENSQPTSYSYTDPGHLNRLMSVTRPDSAKITYAYDDTNKTVTVNTPVQGTNVVKQVNAYDGLGRTTTVTTQDSSSTTYSIVATQYDLMGRAYKVSNSYTGSPSYWTETDFDALGRPKQTVLPAPDSATTTYVYASKFTTITDPAGKARKTQADGLGRLAIVFEPDVTNGNSLTQQTTYAYNVLDALTTVTQGAQTRTYGYDALGRLTSMATPETAGIAALYQYNNYDLVTQRTDPRGVITTYGYDTLNRLHTISYNVTGTGVAATPGVTLNYGSSPASNNNGRLLTMTDGVGSETYSYDVLGEVTQVQKVVGTTTYMTGYGYNLAGELSSITYPSGRVVQQSFDMIGRLTTVASGATNYASGFGYNTAFQVTGFNYGNGVAATLSYSPDRLQMTALSYVKGATTLYSLNYYYKTDATHCPTGTANNNGQIQCITDNADNGRSAKYTYDALARLTAASTTGSTGYPAWGLSFTYDRYANRTQQSILSGCTGITCPTNSVVVSTSTNRITTSGYAYDANGNMTNDGSNALTYDGENHLVTSNVSAGIYTYDGNGLRVKKGVSGTTTVYAFSGSKVVAEYVNGAAPTSPTREYIYSGSALVAKIEAGTTQYYHSDLLSVRAMSDSSGNKIGEQGHYPFGESWYTSSTTTKWQFTSYERDGESGNDYAMARYHVNRLGRLSSPDPLAGSISNPQSLNRYAYVRGEPINLTDPLGLHDNLVCDDDGECYDAPPDVTSIQVQGSATVYDTTEANLNASNGLGDDLALFFMSMGSPGGEKDPKSQFLDCLSKFGDANAKKNLTYEGFLAAQQAAATAQTDASTVLALWDNENSLRPQFGPIGPKGEIGPMQIRPPVVNELSNAKILPSGYQTSLSANLTAGALYFSRLEDHYNVPETRAASVYNGGLKNWGSAAAQAYQNSFDTRKAMFSSLVNCTRETK